MKKLTPICKICGAETYQLKDEQFSTVYLRCKACGFIHLADPYHVSFQAERAEYDLHENSIEDEGYVKYLDGFLKKAVDPFIQGGQALDFGCGPEPVLAELLKRRKFLVKTFDRHFDHDADALSSQYDLITSTEVFEHFHDPDKEIKRICTLLKPDGVLAVMTSVPPDDEAFLKWSYRREQTHISFFTKETFEYLAKAHGLDILLHDSKRITVFKKR